MSEEMLPGTQILIIPLNLANDSVFTIITPTVLSGHAGGTMAQTAQGTGPVATCTVAHMKLK